MGRCRHDCRGGGKSQVVAWRAFTKVILAVRLYFRLSQISKTDRLPIERVVRKGSRVGQRMSIETSWKNCRAVS